VKRNNQGEIIYDANGDVTYEYISLSLLATIGGWVIRNSSGSVIVDKTVSSVPCGYRTSTRNISEQGEVVSYNVTLHCPPFGTELFYDDILEITDYDRTYKARMVKKVTFNRGTAVWFDEIKN